MTQLTTHLQAWRERRDREREIAAFPPEEIAAYGLSPAEFRAVALMPDEQVARMEAMARLHGLDPARLDEDRTLRLATTLACATCGEQRRCRRALSQGAAPEETEFCPNAGTYRTLAAE